MGLIYLLISCIIFFQFVTLYALAEVYFSFKNSPNNNPKSIKLLKERVLLNIAIFIAVGFIAFSFFSPTFFTSRLDETQLGNLPSEGQLGDKLGGLMNPFISIAAVIVTGLAFYAQYNANKLIKDQFKIEQFENKYYELLRIHIDNVKMMKISDSIESRKCFVHMFYELRFCYYIFYEAKANFFRENKSAIHEDVNIMSIAYKVFFYGIGGNSEKFFLKKLSENEKKICKMGIRELQKVQIFYNQKKRIDPDKRYFYTRNFEMLNSNVMLKLFYFPFDGHQNKLGHYYRHLFQTVKYVVENNSIDKDQKYTYIKTCRAQLSNYEQLMLYYNALGWFEKEWHELFTNYRLIKNLPIQLADFDKPPLEYFKDDIVRLERKGIKMFEWLEE